MNATPRKRAPRGEGEQLRAQILDATEELLAREGDQDAVSIRAIASRVGCTAPSIYRHFDDKTALIFEVCDRLFEDLQAEMTARAGALADPIEVLHAIGRAYLEFGLAHPEQYRIMFMTRTTNPTPDSFLDRVVGEDTTFGILVGAIAAAMDSGAIAGGDAFRMAVDFWTMAHGVTSLAISGTPFFPYPDPRDELDRLTDLALRALTP